MVNCGISGQVRDDNLFKITRIFNHQIKLKLPKNQSYLKKISLEKFC